MRTPIVLIACTLVATAAAAQTPPAAPAPASADAMRDKMLAMDTNKDGKWDKAEWLAGGRRERGFDFLDSDKDGFVTPTELKAGMARLRGMGMTPN